MWHSPNTHKCIVPLGKPFLLTSIPGSERNKSSGASGDQLKEACSINESLSNLGLVMLRLGQRGCGLPIPYRDSKLTFLLKVGFSLEFWSLTLRDDVLIHT